MRFLLEKSLAAKAEAYLAGHDIEVFSTEEATREALLARAPNIDALGFRWQLPFPLDRDFLSNWCRLGHVHKSGAGLEHSQVLDVSALTEMGVLFSNNVGINADAVAEHAVMLALLALRPASLEQMWSMRRGVWNAKAGASLPAPRMLQGRTVGIVGMGRIGTAIAQRLKPMNVGRILGYRRRPLSAEASAVAEAASLDDIVSAADLLILCLPIDASTRNLFDAGRIAKIRPGATLVNVGRGAVLDEAALFDALSSGRLRAAGLDVLAEEPSQSPLMRLPNVILTPHTAGTALEIQELQITASLEALADFAAGKVPPRLQNAAVLALPQLRARHLAKAPQDHAD